MKQALAIAVRRLSVLKFFPADAVAQAEIMRMLERMVSEERQLAWLVDTLIDSVDEWPGLRSLRGLFCTRFKPRDGIEATCGLAGFTGEDSEGRAALEPATHLLCGAAETPMNPDELRRFHDELLKPLLRRSQPPRIDRETLRRVEQEIAMCKPTLTQEEKDRRIREIEDSLNQTGTGQPAQQKGLL
jgi:hypothetical protein